jgi:hypothetical protein
VFVALLVFVLVEVTFGVCCTLDLFLSSVGGGLEETTFLFLFDEGDCESFGGGAAVWKLIKIKESAQLINCFQCEGFTGTHFKV